jgi:hypothetical protein
MVLYSVREGSLITGGYGKVNMFFSEHFKTVMKLHLNEMCHEVTIFLPNEIKVSVVFIEVDRLPLENGHLFFNIAIL